MLKNAILTVLGAFLGLLLFKPVAIIVLVGISVGCYIYRDDLKDAIMFLRTKKIKG
jgi:hypothetical protein